MELEFRKIFDFNYAISNQGHIMNLSTLKILKPNLKKTGYLEAVLTDDEGNHRCALVHRLVASYFCDCKDGATEVNHIDGNKLNNIASNLEWVTRNENLKHAYKNGLRKDDVSAKSVIATNTVTGEEIEFSSIYKAARFFGISQGNICMCCKGMRPYANGFFWRYKEEDDE